jgi:hypothetical protein
MADGRVYRVCGMRLRSAVALPELTRVASGRADCALSISRSPVRTDGVDWFHRWRPKSGPTWLHIGRGDRRYVLRFPDLADFDVSPSGRRIVAHLHPRVPVATWRHLFLDQVLPLALGRMGRIPIHASAVHLPGVGVVAFAGGTGCGKSTLAAALARQGGVVLSDDCLVVTIRRGRVWAVPSYGGIRLWPDDAARLGYRGRPVAHYTDKVRVGPSGMPSADRPARLRVLFLLSRPSAAVRGVSMQARGARERFMGLMRLTYLLDVEDRAALTALFRHLALVSERVPIAGLRLARDRPRLPALAREVRDLAGRFARAVSC